MKIFIMGNSFFIGYFLVWKKRKVNAFPNISYKACEMTKYSYKNNSKLYWP